MNHPLEDFRRAQWCYVVAYDRGSLYTTSTAIAVGALFAQSAVG